MGTDNCIAVKIFKGDVTSDGYPQDELDCCLSAGEQENLIKVVAQLDQTDAENKLGLVMELIPPSFYNLGLPPSLITCTRDTFEQGTVFDAYTIAKIALQMANAMNHLHENGISHGDVYAHNTMINDQADMLFGDFGAATNLRSLTQSQREAMERIEVRAFACLLDDLLSMSLAEGFSASDSAAENNNAFVALIEIKNQCMSSDSSQRPSFAAVQKLCQSLMQVSF
jgi:serine/threonine protein kinase